MYKEFERSEQMDDSDKKRQLYPGFSALAMKRTLSCLEGTGFAAGGEGIWLKFERGAAAPLLAVAEELGMAPPTRAEMEHWLSALQWLLQVQVAGVTLLASFLKEIVANEKDLEPAWPLLQHIASSRITGATLEVGMCDGITRAYHWLVQEEPMKQLRIWYKKRSLGLALTRVPHWTEGAARAEVYDLRRFLGALLSPVHLQRGQQPSVESYKVER